MIYTIIDINTAHINIIDTYMYICAHPHFASD